MGKDLKGKELGRGLSQRQMGAIWVERRWKESQLCYMAGK